jgi:hypothetical protein
MYTHRKMVNQKNMKATKTMTKKQVKPKVQQKATKKGSGKM